MTVKSAHYSPRRVGINGAITADVILDPNQCTSCANCVLQEFNAKRRPEVSTRLAIGPTSTVTGWRDQQEGLMQTQRGWLRSMPWGSE